MICTNCGQPVSFGAIKCNHCNKETGLKPAEFAVLRQDMFECSVKELFPDDNKKDKRDEWLKQMPELQEIAETRRNLIHDMTGTAFIILGIGILIPLFVGVVNYVTTKSWITIATILALYASIFIIGVTAFAIKSWKKLPKVKFNKEMEIHQTMPKYYFSDRVFGYMKAKYFTDIEKRDEGYSCYEFELDKIVDIQYNDKFKEFIVKLTDPVYSDYKYKPSNVVRIADVFDNGELAKALKRSLPIVK